MPPPQDWSELPELLLLSIILRLPSLPDFFSFAGVCRSWRSFLRSSSSHHYLSSRPPLLLVPNLNPNPNPNLNSFRPQTLNRNPNPFLQTLDLPKSQFRSLMPPPSPSLLCLGYSHGHLILLHRPSGGPHHHHHHPILADALTGSQIKPQPLPSVRFPYYYAALTAPPSSPNSLLLIFYSQHHFLYLPLAGGPHSDWLTHRLDLSVHITRVLPFENRTALAVNDRANKLLQLDFGGKLTVKISNVTGISKGTVFDRWHFGPQLVECGGDLLLVLFVKQKENGGIVMIDVYKLDFERMVWMGLEELVDYALFVDCGGKCPVSCYKPERWGGRSNCVYLAGTGFDSWTELPLGGKMIDGFHTSPPLSSSCLSEPRWPSPIWVYPSLFF